MGYMGTLNRTGHMKVAWDPKDDAEIKAARKQFNRMVKKKGYSALVSGGDKPGRRIDEFDPNAQEITLIKPLAGG